MPLSRLRLRMAVWYAVAYLIGLTVLDVSIYFYLTVFIIFHELKLQINCSVIYK